MGPEVPASVVLNSQFLHLLLRLLHFCTFASLFLAIPTTETSPSLRSHFFNKYSQRPTYTKDPVIDNDGDLPNDPYMSYLLWPHFHFSGTYRTDALTVNNRGFRYDTEHFVPEDLLQTGANYNPKGNNEWSVTGFVTNVCYANGTCVGEDEKDKGAEPLVGTPIQDGSNKTAAKMVALDVSAQMFSEIWGWKIQIGNLFSGDVTPVPFQYAKSTLTKDLGDAGVIYQSVLSNIRWIDTGKNSPFIKQLQNIMKNDNIDSDKLSIRLNMATYDAQVNSDNFTTGPVSGTIGLLGRKSPPFFTHGRMMKPLVNYFQHTPFYVDQRLRKVFVDFGNSLPFYRNGTFATSLYQNLLVALYLDKNASLTCSDDMLWLGMVHDKLPNWYQNRAGVQVFPARGALSDEEMEKLSNNPLVVVERGYFPGDIQKFHKHRYTIGGFYNNILNALGYLTDCGTNNSIFTGDKSRQLDYNGWSVHGHTIKVYDYDTAVEAIHGIIEEGEGSSPCNPVAWNSESQKALSHYFLFYSVVENHEISVVEQEMPTDRNDDSMADFSQLCRGTYYFNGSKIPFDPEGVWPMVSNPQMSKYRNGSKAYKKAQTFNKVYTKLMRSLHNVFNGHPETFDDAMGLMYSVDLHLKKLVSTPIDDNGDPYVGPNAGPTFDFSPL